MRIVVKVRHTEVSDELKAYAQEKICGKVLNMFPDADDSFVCDIEFDDQFGDKGGEDKRIDVTLSLPHRGEPLHLEESDASFQEAIDRIVDRLDKPLERYKETGK